jgi:hypothetical protein
MSAHTPGPWKPCRSHVGFDGPYYEPDPDEVAEFNAKPFVRIEAATGSVAAAHDLFEFEKADATLMAASPEMLAALKAVEKWWLEVEMASGRTGAPAAIFMVRSAIEKAEGRS